MVARRRAMPPSRCVLCHRLLMEFPPPSTPHVANPESLVLCLVCEALPGDDRRQQRDQLMVRMLDDVQRQHRRASGSAWFAEGADTADVAEARRLLR